MTYITINDIASMIGESPRYVRRELVHRADFPRPALVLSQRIRKWLVDDVESWLEAQRKKWAR